MRRVIIVFAALTCLGLGAAATATGIPDAPLGLSQLLGADDEITVTGEQIREELQKHAGFVPRRVTLPKQPVSSRRCMAPVIRQPLKLVDTAVGNRRMVSVYRTLAGGYIKQTCTRSGHFRSLRATSPHATPDGLRQLLTETLRQEGELLYGRHFDYTETSISSAWQSPDLRRKMIRNGRIR